MKKTSFKIIFSITVFFLIIFILEYSLSFLGFNETKKNIEINYSGEEDWRYYHMYKDIHFCNDSELLWKGNPDYSAFNSEGFHTREFSLKKENHEVRVFCIGDSNTLGNLKYSYPEMLEEVLNKNKKNRKYKVYNLGMYGYSSIQGLVVLKKFIKYKPDFIIINFGWNEPVFVERNDNELIAILKKQSGMRNSMFLKMLRSTRLFALIRLIGLKIRKRPKLKPRVTEDVFESNYKEMIEICSAEKIKIILLTRAINPDAIIPEGDWRLNVPTYNDIVVKIGQEKNIHVIRANQHIKEKEDFIDECHYSLSGYKSMIDLIKEVVVQDINK